jgi:hypothetical protein
MVYKTTQHTTSVVKKTHPLEQEEGSYIANNASDTSSSIFLGMLKNALVALFIYVLNTFLST